MPSNRQERGIAQLLTAVQKVLFNEWDPIGINKHEAARGEYDSYAPKIVQLLSAGVDERALSIQLGKYRDNMGLGGGESLRDHLVARRLLNLVESIVKN